MTFLLFYLNDLKSSEPKNTLHPTPNQLTNQPTNQSRCASCIMIDDYNKRRALCCFCMDRSVCDLVCLLQSARWCHSPCLLQTHVHAHTRTYVHRCVRAHTHTLSLSLSLSLSHRHFSLLWTVPYIVFLATLYIKLYQLHRNSFFFFLFYFILFYFILFYFILFRFGFRSVLYNNSVSFVSIKNLLFVKKKFYVNSFIYLSFHVCISNSHKKLKLHEVNI